MACAAVLLSAPLSAQTPRGTSVIDGAVTDTNLVSLANVTAAIQGSNVRVTTGDNGRFRIVGLAAGEVVLVLSKAGFLSSSTIIQVTDGDTLRVSFELKPGVDPPLPAARNNGLLEFEERRKSRPGQFKTLAEIARLNPKTTRDLLRSFTSIRVVGGDVLARRENIVEDGCHFQLFVNATPIRNNTIDDLPAPGDIAAIEVYAIPSNVPLSLKTTRESNCGAVLLWTKSGL
jgi:hypothetical protein